MESRFGQMDRKTKISRRGSNSNRVKHPYKKYQSSPIWKILDHAIGDLVENGDVKETTRREYIVGYLSKKL
jgi:hypothetical protein